MKLVVPQNTSATVVLPDTYNEIMESGKRLEESACISTADDTMGKAHIKVGSGEYYFECSQKT